VLHKRPAASLVLSIPDELLVERLQLLVYPLDHGQSEADGLATGRAEFQCGKPLTPIEGKQMRMRRLALVVENRLNALLPGAAIIQQGLTQAHDGAQFLDGMRS